MLRVSHIATESTANSSREPVEQCDVLELQQAVQSGIEAGEDGAEGEGGAGAPPQRPVVQRGLGDDRRRAHEIGQRETDLLGDRQQQQIEDRRATRPIRPYCATCGRVPVAISNSRQATKVSPMNMMPYLIARSVSR